LAMSSDYPHGAASREYRCDQLSRALHGRRV
jgi:hypothetical protein